MRTTGEKLLPAAEEPKLLEAPHSEAKRPPRNRRRFFFLIAGLLVLFAILFVFGYFLHRRTEKAAGAAAEKEKTRLPIVNVVKVQRSPAHSALLVPGNITPLTEASLYARASGYVRKRYADIGDWVRRGQLLAEVEAPDLDQQVEQARAAVAQSQKQLLQAQADLDSARSQLELAQVTWDRYKVLADHGAIARQDADQQLTAFRNARANVGAAQANVASVEQSVEGARANLQRLLALQSYEKIRAPFDGVITARSFDIGALISSGGSAQGGLSAPGNSGATDTLVSPQSGNGELFRIAQIGTLRILINVPQANAPTIRVGQPATVLVEQFSKTPFKGQVTRTANSVDLNTRTLLTEVQIANPKHMLLPGLYAQVQLTNARPDPPLLVPGDSIIVGPNGIQVAMLQDLKRHDSGQQHYPPNAKRVHIQKVEIGRDYGAQIEVTQGLEGWEYVIVNPSDAAEEGAVVQPSAAPRAPGQGNPQRQGPSDRNPAGIQSAGPGTADTGGRGASTKGGSGK